MPSPRSVPRHWPFQHCFQSLFVLVLLPVWNRTKIESGSFPMNLFLWSTVWYSLIILRMSWPGATLNSWPSWLWHHNSSPPLSPKPHCAMLENQVIWLYDLGFCFWGLDSLRTKIAFFGRDLKAVAYKFKSPGTTNLYESFERIVKTWSETSIWQSPQIKVPMSGGRGGLWVCRVIYTHCQGSVVSGNVSHEWGTNTHKFCEPFVLLYTTLYDL